MAGSQNILSLNLPDQPGTPVTTSLGVLITAVPEPSSVALMGLGLVGLVGVKRYRRRTA